jgi:hypothetical protein
MQEGNVSEVQIHVTIKFDNEIPVVDQLVSPDDELIEKLAGKKFPELSHEERRDVAQCMFADIIETGVAEFEYTIPDPETEE